VDWPAAVSAAVTVRRDAAFKALSRSEKLSLITRHNLGNARNPMRTFLRRRIVRLEDRAAVTIASRMADAMIADKGGEEHVTAGERALIENATVARVVSLICLREISEKGAFIEQGRVASSALTTLVKYLGAERQAIQALGTSRVAVPALTLEAYTAQLAAKKTSESQ
jgi:hypothetical protein